MMAIELKRNGTASQIMNEKKNQHQNQREKDAKIVVQFHSTATAQNIAKGVIK